MYFGVCWPYLPQIGDVDEGVVERREDTGNAEDELACNGLGQRSVLLRVRGLEERGAAILTLTDLRSEGDVLLRGAGGLLGRHFVCFLARRNLVRN